MIVGALATLSALATAAPVFNEKRTDDEASCSACQEEFLACSVVSLLPPPYHETKSNYYLLALRPLHLRKDMQASCLLEHYGECSIVPYMSPLLC